MNSTAIVVKSVTMIRFHVLYNPSFDRLVPPDDPLVGRGADAPMIEPFITN